MYKKFNLFVGLLFAVILGAGCGGGSKAPAAIREEKIRNAFKIPEVAAKKEALKNIISKLSLPEKEEIKNAVEDTLKGIEEGLVTCSKEGFNAALVKSDEILESVKDARPAVERFLKSMPAVRSNADDLVALINKTIQASSSDLQDLLMRTLEEELKSSSDFKNVPTASMMEVYDAAYDLFSEILKGLQGITD